MFSLGHPWPTCLPWASSTLFLTLYSHGLLLASLGFGPTAAHSYFFHIIHCPWVCYSLFLSFRILLSSFAFSRPIYLFHRRVIHYSYRLDLMVFVLYLLPTSFRSVLLGWASSLLFGFHKKTLNTAHKLTCPLNKLKSLESYSNPKTKYENFGISSTLPC